MRRLIPAGTRLTPGRPGLLAALIAAISLVATQAGAVAAQAGNRTGQAGRAAAAPGPAAAGGAALRAAPGPALAVRSAAPAGAAPRVNFTAWTTPGQFRGGTGNGISVLPGDRRGIVISQPAGTTSYRDPYLHDTRAWDYSTWTSPVHTLDFGATELVASWDAQVPAGTWLKTELQATMADGEQTPWLDMGNYAYLDTDIARTSVSPVAKPFGEVDTDTFFTYAGWSVRAYQLRLTLYRQPGTAVSPRVWQAGAFASFIPPRTTVPASLPGPASQQGTGLPVPAYSQDIHAGQYKKYGGGGEAWCSPTSNEMVDEYWGMHPSAADLAWVNPKYQDPSVDYAARYTYDSLYQGTGNWPFNAAYASHFGLDAEIVQLPSMADLEQLVSHGFPVVTSQAFDQGEITGAGYNTAGHLWVVTGFTRDGNVIVNDPANPSDAQVRHVFNRRQFENVWLRTYWTRPDGSTGFGSGGVAYIIKPHDKPLPPNLDPANPAW
ncbi:MAG: C39 family peptidase [Nocardiopsaceae bacterium]|nr:C39 family peptidase [Nocardiopsaceae bacterium]